MYVFVFMCAYVYVCRYIYMYCVYIMYMYISMHMCVHICMCVCIWGLSKYISYIHPSFFLNAQITFYYIKKLSFNFF